jgi:mannose-6-phosphate isomerase
METLERDLPGDAETRIGESWELADLPRTSPSGGGGSPERSLVINGPLAGATLNQLIREYGKQLVGHLPLTGEGDFPLLVKFLDANENLSVQVHPSPEYAAEHPDSYLKSEAWYIIGAEPGAVIYKGIREGVKPQAFRKAIESNDPELLESMLIRVTVEPGDCHYLPSGTCHALGAGILVAEVQTPSDTTYRVFDWGRTDRELHVEQAMQCIEFGPPNTEQYETRTRLKSNGVLQTRLVICDFFRIDEMRVHAGETLDTPAREPLVWIVLDGEGVIKSNNGSAPVEFRRGETLLLPAALRCKVTTSQPSIWLEVSFPKANLTQIA